MSPTGAWRFLVAPRVTPAPDALAALERAREAMPGATLLAAHVPGDPVWPRILDKEDAIEACRNGLLAVRALEPGAVLVRGAVGSFAATAALLASERGYLVPAGSASRRGHAPRPPRLRLLVAAHWTREERLWQLFMLAGVLRRRAALGGRPSAIRLREGTRAW